MHPGGVNCAFADGSVKFIKDTINSWPNALTGGRGMFGAPKTLVNCSTGALLPGAWVGVWQALTTRNRGEVISADEY
jgi:prepilin-type processing-associated H-X9-DG protein